MTLEGWGVFVLLAFVAAAGAGWAFYVISRRERPGSRAGTREAPPPAVPPPARDPLEAAFDALAEGLADAVLLCREWRIARARGRSEIAGGDPAALVGLPLTALIAAEDVLAASEILRSAPESGSVLRFTMSPPSARRMPRMVEARLLRAAGGGAGDFVAVINDVTGATLATRIAASAATRVSDALAHLPDAVVVTRGAAEAEIVTHANPAAEALLASDPGSLKGLTLRALRERASKAFDPSTAARLFPDGDPPGEERIRIEHGEPRDLERVVQKLGGGRSARLFVVRDVSSAVAREEHLRRAAQEAESTMLSLEERQEQILMANEGLEKRISESARFNRELKAIDEMKSNFLANVSHELQTPLVSIRGYTEMILKGRMGPLTEEQERGLKVALRNVDRLIGLIDSLLSFVRTEKDSEPLRLEVFPLKQVIDEVLELLADRAAERSVTFHVHVPPGDLMIRADRNRIAQVFINLVGNAVKYNRRGGRVDIEAARGSRSTARVEIRDTGEGIPREEIDKIFERFYRGSSASGEGSGLGLAIARDILRLHGCQIRADSDPGTGSAFSFTLPLEARGRSERTGRLAGSDREEP